MTVVRLLIFAFDSISRNTIFSYQGCRDIILRRKWIGGAQNKVSATGLQGNRQIGCLGGYMQTAGHTYAFERLIFGKTFTDKTEDRHFFRGPFDTVFTAWSQGAIFNVSTS